MLKNFYHFLKNNLRVRLMVTTAGELKKALRGMKTVLDIGCGPTSPLKEFKKELGIYSVGIDIFPENINASKKSLIHDEHYVMDALDIDKKFKEKSFDAVIAIDLIEHLAKEESKELIPKMEAIAKKLIIISTPNDFLEQRGHSGNPFLEHKCGWTLKEMMGLGFKCRGIVGPHFIHGERASIKLKPIKFWSKISLLCQKFINRFPKFAASIICIKKIEKT